MQKQLDCILILDFGSQYTHLIARRIREQNVYSIIVPYHLSEEELNTIIQEKNIILKGIILSGGPGSVSDIECAVIPNFVFTYSLPILGICYGMQALISHEGGKVISTSKKEYGNTLIQIHEHSTIFSDIHVDNINVWMSHGDSIQYLSPSYTSIAHTSNGVIAAVKHIHKAIIGVQFHPELTHTEHGMSMLSYFLFTLCQCNDTWKIKNLVDDYINDIRNTVKDTQVMLAISGGVDSSVLALLLYRALGDKLHCVFVDNGLLRKNEAFYVLKTLKESMNIPIKKIEAQKIFLHALQNVADPEKKRKIIGRKFIEIFESEAKKIDNLRFLAQGTIYPDCIESAKSNTKVAHVIKSHHNVGGLPERLSLTLIEPLQNLFKDEVKELGKALSLQDDILYRHPFPGPGLAVRIPGCIDEKKIKILQEADAIFIEELCIHNLYHKVNQAFAVYIPVKSVGVIGDRRCYDDIIGLRAVETVDFMSARWAHLPYDFLSHVSHRIINEIHTISRVVYDISDKPPATIEWE